MKKTEHHHRHNELTESTKSSMKTRIITGIIAIVCIVPFIFLGDWFFAALVMFASIVSTTEIIRCLKVKKSVPYLIGLTVISIIICIFIVFWPFLLNLFTKIKEDSWFHLYAYFDRLHISILLVFVGFALLFMVVVLFSSFTARDASFMFTMLVVISLGLQSLLFLRYYPSFLEYEASKILNSEAPPAPLFNTFDSFEASLLVIYVVVSTFMTDTGAYFFGLFFGKKKINERISPKKTYAGFIGGLITSFVFSCGFAFIFISTGYPLLKGTLDLNHWYYVVALSAIIPLFATLGDFVFSSIKRFYNIKDYGNFLPGHGGILDRIDSLLFSLTASALFIWIVTNIGTDLLFLL